MTQTNRRSSFKAAHEYLDRAEKEGFVMVLFVGNEADSHLITNVPLDSAGALHGYLLKAASMLGESSGN